MNVKFTKIAYHTIVAPVAKVNSVVLNVIKVITLCFILQMHAMLILLLNAFNGYTSNCFSEGKKCCGLRALIDPGSQSSFISLNAAKQLGLPKRKILVSITGIGDVEAGTVSKAIIIEIASIWNSTFQKKIETYILKTLLPDDSCKVSKPSWINTLQLADPDFNKSSGIDLVLGADVFDQTIELEIKKGNPLLAQKTKLGWIISGTYPLKNTFPKRIVASVSTMQLERSMKKFFEMDTDESTDSGIKEEHFQWQQRH